MNTGMQSSKLFGDTPLIQSYFTGIITSIIYKCKCLQDAASKIMEVLYGGQV